MDAAQHSPCRSTLTLWGLLEVGGVLLCLATVTGFLGRVWWILELTSHFRLHLAVTASSGRPFGLVSVDLAEFSTLYQEPLSVQFVGYKSDGSSIMTEFITDGIIDGAGPLSNFQTFYFDARFADVVRVEVPTYRWSLDNMVFASIPEPGTWALLLLGGGLLLYVLRHGKRC